MKTMEAPWRLEAECQSQGITRVCGVDEAGAGPLAGPVYAAAVILDPEAIPEGLNDSKKLTEKQRETLYDRICEQAVAWAVAWADVEEIEEMNILNARLLAMQRAMEALTPPAEFALIDGNRDHGDRVSLCMPHQTVVGGDGKSASIAAASILAKVSRDRYVCRVLDAQYPQYQFARHKGYGTRLHYEMLDRFGPCPAHRMSFLKKWKAGKP